MAGYLDASNRSWWDSKSNSEKEELFDYIEEVGDETAQDKLQDIRNNSDTGFKLSASILRFLRKWDNER